MTRTKSKVQDKSTSLIYRKLKAKFPSLSDDPNEVVYRYNPASIRIRVVDPTFAGKSYEQREAEITPILESLPTGIQTDVTLLLLLTPHEAEDSNDLMNLEFDDPSRTRL